MADDFVSFDDFSYQPGLVAQEIDRESGSVLGISGSDKNEPFVVKLPPPVELVTGDIEARVGNADPQYQKARVKRDSESSGSDEPDEESESYGSTDAFVSSGSHKNMNPSVRLEQKTQTDEIVRSIEQRMCLLYDKKFQSEGHALALSSMDGEIHPQNYPKLSPWLQSIIRSVSPIRLEPATPRGDESLVQTFVRGETHDVGYGTSATSLMQNDMRKIEKMKCPKYKTTTARDNSFVSWPHQNPSKEKMVDAGFFHIPGDEEAPDLVQCYKCGKFLEKFKPGDDPVVEHDRFYPDCKSTEWVE